MGTNDEDFQALYKRHHERTVALMRRLGFAETARDLAQDVFVRVYRHMDAYRKEAGWTYIEKIARRLAANQIRDIHAQKRDRDKTVPLETAVTIADNQQASPETQAIQHQQSARLQKAMTGLSDKCREALLYQLGGFSYEEIAKLLGISVEAVKSRLHEARNELKKVMDQS